VQLIETTPADLRAALKATPRADYLALIPSNGDPPTYVDAGLVRRALDATGWRLGARVYVCPAEGARDATLEFRWGSVGRLRLYSRPRHALGR
jgi:hypothetical protein